ncbi:MAG: hypothetical protein S4CHLAM123_02560 [Chlamydiales bacterium]|nr:hypothetical protein [Chlamydiales bacterium]
MSSKVSASTSFPSSILKKPPKKDSISEFVEGKLNVSFQEVRVTNKTRAHSFPGPGTALADNTMKKSYSVAQFGTPLKKKNMELLEKFVIQKIKDGIEDTDLIYTGFIQQHGLLLTEIPLKIPNLPQIFGGVQSPTIFNKRYQSLTKKAKKQVCENLGKSAIKDLQKIEKKFKYLKANIQSILTYKRLEQAYHNRFFEAPLSEKIKQITAQEVFRTLFTHEFESSSSPKKSKKMHTDQQLFDAKAKEWLFLSKAEATELYTQLTDTHIFFIHEMDSLKDELTPIFSKKGYCIMLLAGLKNLAFRKTSPLFAAFNSWQLAELENWMGDQSNVDPSVVVAAFCEQRQLEIVNVYKKTPIFSLLQAMSTNAFEILIKYLHSECSCVFDKAEGEVYLSEESGRANSFTRNNSKFNVLHSKKMAIKKNTQKFGSVELTLEVTGESGSDQFGVKFQFSNLKFTDELSWDQRILIFKELFFNSLC